MLSGVNFAAGTTLPRLIPVNEPIQFVAIRPVGTKSLLIEQAFDTTARANLITALLRAYRPTHPAMPATAKQYYSGTCQSRRQHSPRPQPARLLFFFTHLPQPVSHSKGLGYAHFVRAATSLEVAEGEAFACTYERTGRCVPPSCAQGILRFVRNNCNVTTYPIK
jgi:hypothetical protein